MKNYSEKEMIGMSEAYEFYTILPEREQEKIPKDFVTEMEECSKIKKGAEINCILDIQADRLTREGVAKMAYICTFLK